ncbi:hypothetical protein [uncultured Flavobacterium sp.]|uniref:hypothetical protein n=1 Tax=uncultured Flavobacterium sp. TaxID=165435 RepID=UPI0025F7A7B9|nr:hypothetical protein [uncultured Flavobacterium sp.]
MRQKTSDYEKLQTIEQKIKSNRQSVDGRMEYDSLYGFYIDTEKILLIEKAGYYSYTIPIKRDAENGKVENLVLSFDVDGSFKSYLTAYSLTSEEKNQLSEGEKVANLETKTSIAALSDNAASSGGSGGGIFHDANGNCFVVDHIWTDQSGTLSWSYVQIDCPADSGGGDAGGSNPGSGTGSNPGGWPGNYPDPGGYENPGGGGSSENGGEVLTEPVLPNASEMPCVQLKRLFSNSPGEPNLKPEIAWLQGKLDVTVENGVQVKKAVNFEGDMVYTPTRRESESNFHVLLGQGPLFVGWLHTHPKNTYGMFSFGDLKFLRSGYDSATPNRKPEIFTMIVCRDPVNPTIINTYALKIDDINALGTKVDAVWNNPDYTSLLNEKERLDAIHEVQSEKYKKSNNQLEKSFLQQFGGFGVSLYKADSNLTSWSKLELSTTPGDLTVTQTPCN